MLNPSPMSPERTGESVYEGRGARSDSAGSSGSVETVDWAAALLPLAAAVRSAVAFESAPLEPAAGPKIKSLDVEDADTAAPLASAASSFSTSASRVNGFCKNNFPAATVSASFSYSK